MRKNLVVLAVAVLLVVLLAACDNSDGQESVFIPYLAEGADSYTYIRVDDLDQYNGIHLDEVALMIYCGGNGPDAVVTLPPDTVDYVDYDTDIRIDVTLICFVGQELFDQIVGVTPPETSVVPETNQ